MTMAGMRGYRPARRSAAGRTMRHNWPPCVGRFRGLDAEACVLVSYHTRPPVRARLVAGLEPRQWAVGCEVLIAFDDGRVDRPIVMAVMASEDARQGGELSACRVGDATGGADIVAHADVDGRRVCIEAREEIVLRCGKGSISVKQDGKIVIRGTNLLSRSTGMHRIKGAQVDIN